MASTPIADVDIERIYATFHDIGSAVTVGRIGTEENVTRSYRWMNNQQGVLPDLDENGNNLGTAGFRVEDNGGLQIKVSNGRAMVNGFYVSVDPGQTLITLDDDKVILIILRVNNNLAGKVNTTNSLLIVDAPAADSSSLATFADDGILLAVVKTAGADIDFINDMRQSPVQGNMPIGTKGAAITGSFEIDSYSGRIQVPVFGRFTFVCIEGASFTLAGETGGNQSSTAMNQAAAEWTDGEFKNDTGVTTSVRPHGLLFDNGGGRKGGMGLTAVLTGLTGYQGPQNAFFRDWRW